MIDERWIFLGLALQGIGVVSYLAATLQGRVRPNRVSWFFWAAGPLIAFGAEREHGVGLVSLLTFMVGFGPLLILSASFFNRRASWRLTRFDLACGLLCAVGLVLWQVTGNGVVAIASSIAADVLAWLPTVVKSWRFPETENWHFFFFDAVSAAIALLAITTWDFAHYAFPVWVFVSCAILVVLIRCKLGRQPSRAIERLVADEDGKRV